MNIQKETAASHKVRKALGGWIIRDDVYLIYNNLVHKGHYFAFDWN